MGLLNFLKKKEEIIAVINIGSASVGGMLIKKSQGAPPEIITSARVPASFLLDADYDAFWRCTCDSLKKVISGLLIDYPKGPDKVLCVFSFLWGIAQTRVIKVKKDESFEISREFLAKLIDNEIKIFQAQWHSKIPYFKSDSELLERETIKTLLNGYEVKNSFGKKAKNADFFVYMSLIVKGAKNIMEKYFLENFGNVPVVFHTLPFVVFSALKNLVNAEEGFIFVDVGGETSDISFVRKNILEETASFSRGRNFLTRKIAAEFKTFVEEAISLLNNYRKGDLNQKASEKARSVIENAKNEWCGFAIKALEEISQKSPLPMNFLFVGDDGAETEFVECLKDESFSKFTILGKPFEVKQISADALKHNFKFRRSFSQDNDVFLLLESFFADKFL